ncbi:hypothetical protein GWI33_023399 [Rhynchophorus ferrugineus]|uniref:Uncharacterized protein n=1 Tax=Rhynchophorus ferrugineus TaxID=354439 RepID=A0A834IM26_RHYFE|nr:hypothetical protein GWI33_023399 [Rhynchophorus ferrugineus]
MASCAPQPYRRFYGLKLSPKVRQEEEVAEKTSKVTFSTGAIDRARPADVKETPDIKWFVKVVGHFSVPYYDIVL